MATAAAALMAQARRELENLFWDKSAFSPDRAIEVHLRLPVQRRYLERMIAEDIVHEAEPGRYWLDLPAWKAMRRQRFVWTMRILALAIVVVLVVAVVDAVAPLV